MNGYGNTGTTSGANANATNPTVTTGAVAIDGTTPDTKLYVGGPAMSWPPAGVSPTPAPAQSCVTQLDASGTVPTLVPAAYLNSCSGCHGPNGAGSALYPSIVNNHTLADLTSFVRGGKTGTYGVMPQFDEAHLSSDDLRRIYAYLSKQPIVETGECTTIARMSDDVIAQNIAAGLIAWRKTETGHDGVGCFECHGADGLTFAYMGYYDGDIMRRAAAHLDEADYISIVDMVHALRDKYSIIKRDPFVARPLQPGGEVLAGNSAQARDLAFGQQLQAMGLTLANGYINNTAQAQKAAAELDNVNLHALRIPIPFNHLTEDLYHNNGAGPLDCSADIDECADHGSLSDWMPIEPHIPADANSMFRAEDAYLADPNLATFYKVLGSLPSASTMPGVYPIGYNYNVDDDKYRSEFILDYCIRREVMGLPGCYDSGEFPFDANKRVVSIWGEGEYANLFGTGLSLQPNCDIGLATCDPAQSPNFFTKITPGAKISDSFQRLRVPWFTMHWVHFDPTLLVTGDATIQQDEYFTRDIFWMNNDQDYGYKAVKPTYSIFAAWEVAMHNMRVLSTPQVADCSKIPYTHPDLGTFPCTAVDLRSGYYPQLCNFAEGKNWFSDSPQQISYAPTDQPRREIYQTVGGNMYRMFLWGLIDKLQEDNWMCDASMQTYRIKRAQTFLNQPEIVAANGAQDSLMFSTLAGLMAQSRTYCPPLDNSATATPATF